MRTTLLFLLLAGVNLLKSQDLIGTPESLILVFNYPNNYFYVELQGREKMRTESDNCFLIDDKPIQVHSISKSVFLDSTQSNLSDDSIILAYIQWEIDYIENTFLFDTHSLVELRTSDKGKDFVFWTYEMPQGDVPEQTDAISTELTQKQLFVLYLVKNYIIGINTPSFNEDDFDTLKNYLLSLIDGIIESENEFDLEELYNNVNR